MRRGSRRRAFTLTEILVTMAIVIILAAITIPRIMRARLNTNENAVVTNLKAASTALQMFAGRNLIGGAPSYPVSLSSITLIGVPAGQPPYLDSTWSDAAGSWTIHKCGYKFEYTPVSAGGILGNTAYWIDAVPAVYRITGIRSFYIDEQGVVYGQDNSCNPAGGHQAARTAGWPAILN